MSHLTEQFAHTPYPYQKKSTNSSRVQSPAYTDKNVEKGNSKFSHSKRPYSHNSTLAEKNSIKDESFAHKNQLDSDGTKRRILSAPIQNNSSIEKDISYLDTDGKEIFIDPSENSSLDPRFANNSGNDDLDIAWIATTLNQDFVVEANDSIGFDLNNDFTRLGLIEESTSLLGFDNPEIPKHATGSLRKKSQAIDSDPTKATPQYLQEESKMKPFEKFGIERIDTASTDENPRLDTTQPARTSSKSPSSPKQSSPKPLSRSSTPKYFSYLSYGGGTGSARQTPTASSREPKTPLQSTSPTSPEPPQRTQNQLHPLQPSLSAKNIERSTYANNIETPKPSTSPSRLYADAQTFELSKSMPLIIHSSSKPKPYSAMPSNYLASSTDRSFTAFSATSASSSRVKKAKKKKGLTKQSFEGPSLQSPYVEHLKYPSQFDHIIKTGTGFNLNVLVSNITKSKKSPSSSPKSSNHLKSSLSRPDLHLNEPELLQKSLNSMPSLKTNRNIARAMNPNGQLATWSANFPLSPLVSKTNSRNGIVREQQARPVPQRNIDSIISKLRPPISMHISQQIDQKSRLNDMNRLIRPPLTQTLSSQLQTANSPSLPLLDTTMTGIARDGFEGAPPEIQSSLSAFYGSSQQNAQALHDIHKDPLYKILSDEIELLVPNKTKKKHLIRSLKSKSNRRRTLESLESFQASELKPLCSFEHLPPAVWVTCRITYFLIMAYYECVLRVPQEEIFISELRQDMRLDSFWDIIQSHYEKDRLNTGSIKFLYSWSYLQQLLAKPILFANALHVIENGVTSKSIMHLTSGPGDDEAHELQDDRLALSYGKNLFADSFPLAAVEELRQLVQQGNDLFSVDKLASVVPISAKLCRWCHRIIASVYSSCLSRMRMNLNSYDQLMIHTAFKESRPADVSRVGDSIHRNPIFFKTNGSNISSDPPVDPFTPLVHTTQGNDHPTSSALATPLINGSILDASIGMDSNRTSSASANHHAFTPNVNFLLSVESYFEEPSSQFELNSASLVRALSIVRPVDNFDVFFDFHFQFNSYPDAEFFDEDRIDSDLVTKKDALEAILSSVSSSPLHRLSHLDQNTTKSLNYSFAARYLDQFVPLDEFNYYLHPTLTYCLLKENAVDVMVTANPKSMISLQTKADLSDPIVAISKLYSLKQNFYRLSDLLHFSMVLLPSNPLPPPQLADYQEDSPRDCVINTPKGDIRLSSRLHQLISAQHNTIKKFVVLINDDSNRSWAAFQMACRLANPSDQIVLLHIPEVIPVSFVLSRKKFYLTKYSYEKYLKECMKRIERLTSIYKAAGYNIFVDKIPTFEEEASKFLKWNQLYLSGMRLLVENAKFDWIIQLESLQEETSTSTQTHYLSNLMVVEIANKALIKARSLHPDFLVIGSTAKDIIDAMFPIEMINLSFPNTFYDAITMFSSTRPERGGHSHPHQSRSVSHQDTNRNPTNLPSTEDKGSEDQLDLFPEKYDLGHQDPFQSSEDRHLDDYVDDFHASSEGQVNFVEEEEYEYDSFIEEDLSPSEGKSLGEQIEIESNRAIGEEDEFEEEDQNLPDITSMLHSLTQTDRTFPSSSIENSLLPDKASIEEFFLDSHSFFFKRHGDSAAGISQHISIEDFYYYSSSEVSFSRSLLFHLNILNEFEAKGITLHQTKPLSLILANK